MIGGCEGSDQTVEDFDTLFEAVQRVSDDGVTKGRLKVEGNDVYVVKGANGDICLEIPHPDVAGAFLAWELLIDELPNSSNVSVFDPKSQRWIPINEAGGVGLTANCRVAQTLVLKL